MPSESVMFNRPTTPWHTARDLALSLAQDRPRETLEIRIVREVPNHAVTSDVIDGVVIADVDNRGVLRRTKLVHEIAPCVPFPIERLLWDRSVRIRLYSASYGRDRLS